MALNYPNKERAVQIHDLIIETSGGKSGVKDLGSLDSILTHIQDDCYYPSIVEKATHLCFQVNKGHCFTDGNKRTSLALTLEFLNSNGIFPVNFFGFMENIAVAVADNIINKEFLQDILESLINDDLDSKEWLKLQIANALDQIKKEQ